MAVSSMKVIFIFSIMEIMLSSINCEIQWTPTAGEFGTPELYAAIVNNSAIAQDLVRNQLEQHNEIKELFLSQTEATTQMANTQTQLAASQTRMENSLGQIINLLQMQSQQLHNMTATMDRVVSVLEHQQETLTKISAQSQLSQNATESGNVDSCEGSKVTKLLELNGNLLENLTVTLNKQLDIDNRTYLQIHPRADDCSQIASQGYHLLSAPYTIVLANELQDVYCDMDTDGGSWTVFQHRYDGTVDFYRPWNEYEEGFGRLDGEFWLGLRKIHRLTQSGSWVLRVDLEAFDGSTAYALYDSFRVGNAETNYRLSLGTYQGGTAGDSMRGSQDLNNMQFSTYDRDNDVWSSGTNCAEHRQGAWWYRSCTGSNLNGRYLGSSRTSPKGMVWYNWKNSWRSLKRSEMKVRRTQ